MPTSIGTSLRRPILHAASIAARVGANPSATHAIDSNISIRSLIKATRMINSAQTQKTVISDAFALS
jgi:hypothetical protein